MAIKIINEPKLYCEDVYGNFTGLFEQGDYIDVEFHNKLLMGRLESIWEDYIVVKTYDYEIITIDIDDIVEIVKL